VLEVIEEFEGMDALAFWHDIKFSLPFARFQPVGDWLTWPEGAADA
jgi:hypothetical protein